MDLKLKGKTALVTGATRGLGLSIARCFAAEGCNLAICARNVDRLEVVAKQLTDYEIDVVPSVVDIKNVAQYRAWVEKIVDQLGRIDILVCNVSAQSRQWRDCFEVDIQGTVNCVETTLPYLEKSRCASIVGIASQAALVSVPNYKPYSAMKAAFISYMGSLSREVGHMGIRVNTVSPSEIYFDGGIWAKIEVERPEKFERAKKKNVFNRLADPDEVARVVVFLASPAASYVTGSNVLVDGAGRDFIHF